MIPEVFNSPFILALLKVGWGVSLLTEIGPSSDCLVSTLRVFDPSEGATYISSGASSAKAVADLRRLIISAHTQIEEGVAV